MHLPPRAFHSSASSAVKTTRPTAAPGEAAMPTVITVAPAFAAWTDRRVQELIELLRIDAGDRRLLVDQTLLDHFDRDANRGMRRPFAATGLQHVELPSWMVNSTSCMSRVVLLEEFEEPGKLACTPPASAPPA